METIAKLLGHSSIATTIIYIKASEIDLKKVINPLDYLEKKLHLKDEEKIQTETREVSPLLVKAFLDLLKL